VNWQSGFTIAQPAPAAPAGNAGAEMWGMFVPMIIVVGLFYFLMVVPQRKEQAKRDALIKGLKKNDRVVTIGGMIGHVANISSDGKEITLKFGDNVRIPFRRSAIHEVVREDLPQTEAKPL
jgi:preprotein translocase subunit YajC